MEGAFAVDSAGLADETEADRSVAECLVTRQALKIGKLIGLSVLMFAAFVATAFKVNVYFRIIFRKIGGPLASDGGLGVDA